MIAQEGQEHIEVDGDVVGTAAEGKLRLIERRRPGRVGYTNPSLIALLRHSRGTKDEPAESDTDSGPDDLAASKGISLGAVIGGILWGSAVLLFG